MTPIQSREEVASSIATDIAGAAAEITAPAPVTLDGSSEYPGNSTAAEKIPEEANYAASISGVLNDFVELIHANTSNLPETSAAPGESGEFVPNSGYFAE